MGPYISKENKSDTMMDIDTMTSSQESNTRKSSLDYKETKFTDQTNQLKKIDKENVTIERIFRISLEESEKFVYLEMFHAQLLSMNKEIAFRITDLDEIVISIINHPERKNKIIEYLFETYHRAVEMIEKRFKNEYDNRYKNIRQVIANYLTLILYSPDNFDIQLNRNEIYSTMKAYLADCDQEELSFFLMDIYNATFHDLSFLSFVFGIFFDIIHQENIESNSHFFNLEKVRKNLTVLTSLFTQFPLTAQVFVQEGKFNPQNIQNGRQFQTMSFLGPYVSMVSFEADANVIRSNLPLNKSTQEFDVSIKSYCNKLNDYLNEVVQLIYSLYACNETCRRGLLNWVYTLIKYNFDRTKMYQNTTTLSKSGFMLNTLIILLKIFFQQQTYLNLTYPKFIFKIISEIDPLFTFSTCRIDFSKFDRVNQDLIKEIIENEFGSDEYNMKQYSLQTEMFFMIHTVSSLIVKSFEDEINRVQNWLDGLIRNNQTNDPMFKDTFAFEKATACYTRYAEFSKNLLKFAEITSVFIFTLNNKKYPQIKLEGVEYGEFLEDFFRHIDTDDNFALSLLPVYLIKNIIQSCIFIRRHNSETLTTEFISCKAVVYFSVIFSSHVDLIRNPHLRSEILDILIYFFVIHSHEKTTKISNIFKILNEEYISKNLVFSMMRVFIDAERLGTSNQFYEKFSVRHKILYLIDNIMKGNRSDFVHKMREYANNFKEDASRMINLLMNDITFLNDECIERLMDIKRYEDLKDDPERYSKLDEETKKLEEDKLKDNDRRIRTELQLFNSSLNFLVNTSKICQSNFINYKLVERLANLLNYSLDVFTSNRGLKLKVKNKKEYGFKPVFVLSSLIATYSAFVDYEEFLEYIVKDERSFKFQNFEKAMDIKEMKKIPVDYVDYENFVRLVNNLKSVEQKIKSAEINYDDADEEFFDPITTLIMEDPVILPSSRMIVDRKTIEIHLMSDPTDPFNRSSLTKEMLITHLDLKDKIMIYMQGKRQNK